MPRPLSPLLLAAIFAALACHPVHASAPTSRPTPPPIQRDRAPTPDVAETTAVVASPGAAAPERPSPRSVSAAATPATEASPPTPLLSSLRGLSSDPAPERITNDTHYLVSNERRLDLFRPDIDGLGGVHVGVGTDQNFVLAGWSRPELMIIVDFDGEVIDLHAIHGALLRAAQDVDAFKRLWSEAGADEALALLAKLEREPPARRERLQALYTRTRARVHKRLRVLTRRYAELDVRSYLDTPAQYDAVRSLHLRGRVITLRGDFTQAGVVRRVGELLREHEREVQLLYLSNIEQYFTYGRAFKDNMLGLPLASSSLVLRTLPGRPAGFQYMLQKGPDFHAWMRAPRVWSVYRLRGLGKGEHLAASERWFITELPPRRGPEAG